MSELLPPPTLDEKWSAVAPPEPKWGDPPRWKTLSIISLVGLFLFAAAAFIADQTDWFGGVPKDATLEVHIEVSCVVKSSTIEYTFTPVVNNPYNLEIVSTQHDIDGLPDNPAILRVTYIDGSGNQRVAEDSVLTPDISTCSGVGGLTA